MEYLPKTDKPRAPEQIIDTLARALSTARRDTYGGDKGAPGVASMALYLDSWCVPALAALLAWVCGDEVVLETDDHHVGLGGEQRAWLPEHLETGDLVRARHAAGVR